MLYKDHWSCHFFKEWGELLLLSLRGWSFGLLLLCLKRILLQKVVIKYLLLSFLLSMLRIPLVRIVSIFPILPKLGGQEHFFLILSILRMSKKCPSRQEEFLPLPLKDKSSLNLLLLSILQDMPSYSKTLVWESTLKIK